MLLPVTGYYLQYMYIPIYTITDTLSSELPPWVSVIRKGNTERVADKGSNQNRWMDGYDKLERDSHNLESRQLMIMGLTDCRWYSRWHQRRNSRWREHEHPLGMFTVHVHSAIIKLQVIRYHFIFTIR